MLPSGLEFAITSRIHGLLDITISSTALFTSYYIQFTVRFYSLSRRYFSSRKSSSILKQLNKLYFTLWSQCADNQCSLDSLNIKYNRILAIRCRTNQVYSLFTFPLLIKKNAIVNDSLHWYEKRIQQTWLWRNCFVFEGLTYIIFTKTFEVWFGLQVMLFLNFKHLYVTLFTLSHPIKTMSRWRLGVQTGCLWTFGKL